MLLVLVRPETQTRRTLSPVDLSPATSPASSHDRHVPAMDTFEPFDNRLGDVPKNPEVMGSGYSKQGVIPRERSADCLPLEKTFSASVRLSECDVRLLRDRILLRRPPPRNKKTMQGRNLREYCNAAWQEALRRSTNYTVLGLPLSKYESRTVS